MKQELAGYDGDRLPNGWPQPTFLSADEDNGLSIEWCFGGQGADDSWRVSFIWDPEMQPNAMVMRTVFGGEQEYEQEPSKIAAALTRYLAPVSKSVKE